MTETIESVKKELKERVSSPFYGKLILSWVLWNWEIPYVTFFVKEDNLVEKNKLEFIAEYLKISSFFDFVDIFFTPLIIAIILIWGFPYITHEAFKVNERFRKMKALKIKKTNEEISKSKDKQLTSLNKTILDLNESNKFDRSQVVELRKLVNYLSTERKSLYKENYSMGISEFKNQFLLLRKEENKIDKISLLVNQFNKSSLGDKFFDKMERRSREFLVENQIIKNRRNIYFLTPYGIFISKHLLFKKFISDLDSLKDDYDLGILDY